MNTNVKQIKKENYFINVNVLVEHEDKDGFYKKGNKLDLINIYIAKDYIISITSPVKMKFYKYKYDSNEYWNSEGIVFSVVLANNEKYYLLEEEFEKFKDIL